MSIKQDERGKLTSMHAAIAAYVLDGDTVAIEGFTACICFAAAHEIIRQGRRDLVLCRMTPDLVYDQMIAAGCARKMIFSYLGNPGVGSLDCVRRAVEKGLPRPIELEEYSHFGMVGRYLAGAYRLPFFPLRSYRGSDLPLVTPLIRRRPASQPRRRHPSRSAGRLRGQHSTLGPAGGAEGGRFCSSPRHRRGRGDRGKRRHPLRPQSHRHPGPAGERGSPRALRHPSLLCAGLLRPG